ncbi:hypothetical protein [Halomonas maura]|uniref:hypothetical protein n=1 Tax=Halomonas maura TaxID=117606 RepID=UPI0025B4B8FF|nr:hypothetical protein [Halomonas maura]MDN3555518.1 hypothetical protein [Halomonas maura]
MINKTMKLALMKAGIKKAEDRQERGNNIRKPFNNNKRKEKQNANLFDRSDKTNERRRSGPGKHHNTPSTLLESENKKFGYRPVGRISKDIDEGIKRVDLGIYDGVGTRRKHTIKDAEEENNPKLTPRGEISLTIDNQDNVHIYDLIKLPSTGINFQPRDAFKSKGDHELIIGLDFGTSYVKAVVGDRVLDKAFAVPFLSAPGIKAYLLPSNLYKNSRGEYSLHPDEVKIDDIKTKIIDNNYHDDRELIEHAVAFISLVLRRIRAWFLDHNADIYSGYSLLWRLAIGIPSAHKDEKSAFYDLLSTAAWILSTSNVIKIRSEHVSSSIFRAKQVLDGAHAEEHEDIVVASLPEIAAQIHGYVLSDSFDPKADNIYLMVDVGAGTVDASLFRVKVAKGRDNFSFFTTSVENNGVYNLHYERLSWWQYWLSNILPPDSHILKDLQRHFNSRPSLEKAPESFKAYVDNVSVTSLCEKSDPDVYFYRKRLLPQVRARAFYRAQKTYGIPVRQLNGIPLFLCGGGSRMRYYNRLKNDLESFPSISWLKAYPRSLRRPNNLIAVGVPKAHYDRLSVAYGLSLIEPGKFSYVIPEPEVNVSEVNDSWKDRYIEK